MQGCPLTTVEQTYLHPQMGMHKHLTHEKGQEKDTEKYKAVETRELALGKRGSSLGPHVTKIFKHC